MRLLDERVPVVALCAGSVDDWADPDLPRVAGATATLRKPFTDEALMHVVREFLP